MPKTEIPMVSYRNADGTRMFLLTAKQTRDAFFLYAVEADGSLKKLGRGKTPTELEQKYEVEKRIRAGSCKRGANRVK